MKSGFTRSWFTAFCSVAAGLCLSLASYAGDLVSARLYTVPEKIYVNQAFEIHFEIETTSGTELNDLQISDFPNNSDLITLGRLETTSQSHIKRGSQDLTVFHYSSPARCHKPSEQTFSPHLQCMLVERRSAGFFTQLQSYPKRFDLAPFTLRVHPLPSEGRPPSFSGAIGTFRLTGSVSPSHVHPGDIATLSLELAGQGWLADTVMPAPAASQLFKGYPMKETLREPLHIKTEQVFIPTTTNANEIAAVRFCFFNPATARYEETAAGPFRFTFSEEVGPKTEAVRVISTADTSPSRPLGVTPIIKQADMTLRQALPLMAVCTSGVVGLLLFLMLFGRHTRLAFLAAAAALAIGVASGRFLDGKVSTATQTLANRAEVRFAPSQTSASLFSLYPGSPVTPLETAGAWTRVDAAGRRGWLPATALKAAVPATPPKDKTSVSH